MLKNLKGGSVKNSHSVGREIKTGGQACGQGFAPQKILATHAEYYAFIAGQWSGMKKQMDDFLNCGNLEAPYRVKNRFRVRNTLRTLRQELFRMMLTDYRFDRLRFLRSGPKCDEYVCNRLSIFFTLIYY